MYSLSLTLNGNVHRSECNTDSPIGTLHTGSAGILSSLRCPHSTECEGTGDHLTTSGGVSWGQGDSRPHPLEHWSTAHCTRQSDRAGERDRLTRHGGGGGGRQGNHQKFCWEKVHKLCINEWD